MKNILFALILLSSTAFADKTKVEITGVDIEKEQVITIVVEANDIYVHMFRANADFAETDKIVIWLDDIESGTYSAMLRINKNNIGAAKKGDFAVGTQILETEVQIEVK